MINEQLFDILFDSIRETFFNLSRSSDDDAKDANGNRKIT
jgi:hypothetical protein